MFHDLNSFIAALDSRRELARVTEPVDPHLEIAAVVDQASKQPKGGPGLLFEQPTEPITSAASAATTGLESLAPGRARAPSRPGVTSTDVGSMGAEERMAKDETSGQGFPFPGTGKTTGPSAEAAL